METFENPTFLSFPRKRESMKPLKGLDSCFRQNDDLLSFGQNSKVLDDRLRQERGFHEQGDA
jgi:hypothetical protein